MVKLCWWHLEIEGPPGTRGSAYTEGKQLGKALMALLNLLSLLVRWAGVIIAHRAFLLPAAGDPTLSQPSYTNTVFMAEILLGRGPRGGEVGSGNVSGPPGAVWWVASVHVSPACYRWVVGRREESISCPGWGSGLRLYLNYCASMSVFCVPQHLCIAQFKFFVLKIQFIASIM